MKFQKQRQKVEEKAVVLMEELIELMPGYLQNVRMDLAILKKSIQDHNIAAIKMVAHRVRGSAISYGHEPLDVTMEKIQNAIEDENFEIVVAQAREFEDYLGKVDRELQFRVGSGP